MKRYYLLLLILAITGLQAMEQRKGQEFAYWEQLPQEIKAHILSYVAGVDSYEKLKELMTVNKEFRALLKIPGVFREFLKELIKNDKPKAELIFMDAAQYGKKQLVERFIQAGINVNIKNEFGEPVLSIAIPTRSAIEIIKLLLAHEADINARYEQFYNSTPLMLAIEAHRPEVIKFLIDHGADVTLKNIDGKTALHLIAQSNQSDIAQMLIDRGADVNAIDNKHATPLISAAQSFWNVNMIKTLLENGAAVNAVDESGNNALMTIAMAKIRFITEKDLLPVIQELINHGTKLFTVNNQGKTAFNLAQEAGNLEIAQFLKERMQQIAEKMAK